MVGVYRIDGPKGFSVNREIVCRGWALALRPSSDDYAAVEPEAKVARVGLLSGSFVTPWEWRRTYETGKTTN
jgi:endonuclease YncB( thermonuclease family)